MILNWLRAAAATILYIDALVSVAIAEGGESLAACS